MLEKLDFKKLNQLYNETSRHLELLNLKVSLENDVNTPNLLNVALENVLFMFRKISEEEMVIADQLKDTLRKTREALHSNFDPHDAEFISLYDELKQLFGKKNLDEITQDEMKQNIMALQTIFEKVTELNRKNNLLKAKYGNDARYARVHKRIMEKGSVSKRESEIADVLLDIKAQADDKILVNRRLLDNEGYFQGLMMNIVFDSFGKTKIELDTESALYINRCVVKEYMNEYQGSR
jgi:type I restriction enzyme R subunit